MLATLAALLQAATAAPPAPPATPPPPACSTPEYRAMDFWVGEWDLSFDAGGGKKGKAVNRITRDELGSCFVTEHFNQADIAYAGLSHSTYDQAREQWVQTWVDNGGGYITLAGGPVAGKPYSFELKTVEPRGAAGKHYRMIWQDVKPDSLTWRWQQLQDDGGYTDSWVIDYKRRK
ncbi:MAG: DUF1579 family protein [Allosphingosinicella sp.]